MFGARLRPLVRRRVDLLAFPHDELQLFFGTDGSFPGFHSYEETQDVGSARLLSAAGPSVGHPVIVAYRLGKGFVVRFGLPELPARLSSDQNAAALLRRTWTLLSR